MSNASGSNNRNKVLFGLSAIVAFVVVAILVWPSNVRKEDASGAIGAVQKHHAPQITQQDVVLGGEEVKAQQKILFNDFREDASKLRSLAANRNEANMRLFEQELAMRASRVQNDALELAQRMNNSRIVADVQEINAMFARGEAFDRQLAAVSEELNSKAQFARLNDVEQQLGHVSLADEQAASRYLQDVESALGNVDRARSLGADVEYLAMIEMESRAVLGALPPNDNRALGALPPSDNRALGDALQLAASRLDAKAQANEAMLASDEAQLAARLSDIESALGTRYNSAAVMDNTVRGNISQAAARLNQRAEAARTMSRLNARSN